MQAFGTGSYLRAGAKFGDGAVIDAQFGTTDVFTILPLTEDDSGATSVTARISP